MKKFAVIFLTLFVALATVSFAVALEESDDVDEIVFDLNETDDDDEEYEEPKPSNPPTSTVEYEYETPIKTEAPSQEPSTDAPSSKPSVSPTTDPTTSQPSAHPTSEVTDAPSSSPTLTPSAAPTTICQIAEVGTKTERKEACSAVDACTWVPQARNKKGACLLLTSCSDINAIPAANQAKKQQCEKSAFGCSFKKGVCGESSAPTPSPSQSPTAPTSASVELTCAEANELKLKRRRKEVCMANEKCVYSGKANKNNGLCVEVNSCDDVNEFQLNGGIRETRCRFVNREMMPCEFIEDSCQAPAAR